MLKKKNRNNCSPKGWRNGFQCFKADLYHQEVLDVPGDNNACRLQRRLGTGAWERHAAQKWRDLDDEEQRRYKAKARIEYRLRPPPRAQPQPQQDLAAGDHPDGRLPWNLGGDGLPLSRQNVIDAEKRGCPFRHSTPRGCETAIKGIVAAPFRGGQDLRDAVHALLEKTKHWWKPCWQLGYCRSLPTVQLQKMIVLHKVIQHLFLSPAFLGKDLATGSDTFLQFTGNGPVTLVKDPHGGLKRQRLQVHKYRLLSLQSLNPMFSYFTCLHDLHGERDVGPIDSQWFPSFVTRTTTQRLATKSNECVHTPTRLHFIDPILWRASAIGMKHELSFHLALTMVQEVEDERVEAWNVRILNYSHISQNELLIRSTRRAQRIFPLFVDEARAEAPVVGAANVLHMLDPLAPVTEPIPIEGVTDSCVEHHDDALLHDMHTDFKIIEEIPGTLRLMPQRRPRPKRKSGAVPPGPPPPPPPADPPPGAPPAVAAVGVNEPVKVKGGRVYMNGVFLGKITAMLQWSPMSLSAHCSAHSNCTVTGDLSDAGEAKLMDWLARGLHHTTAQAHREDLPSDLRAKVPREPRGQKRKP